MEISPTTLILIGVISAILGFLASSLLNTLREEGSEPVVEDEPVPPGGRKGHYTLIARLWRERNSGSLVVEIDGKSLVDASALDETQRARLETSARDLRGWLGMGLVSNRQAQPANLPDQFSATGTVWATSGEALETDLRRALGQEQVFQSERSYVPTPLKPAEDANTQVPGPRSMVLQIEDILQDMIAGTALQQQGIHLSEDPKRGVIVTIGDMQFEGIESVPDLAVKTVIRAAVAEWEQTQ